MMKLWALVTVTYQLAAQNIQIIYTPHYEAVGIILCYGKKHSSVLPFITYHRVPPAGC